MLDVYQHNNLKYLFYLPENFEEGKKYPLVISRIMRDGEYTPSYIAGQQGGINYVKVVPTAGQQH